MQKIIPHLWYDTQAKEAAEFYVAAFGGDSKIHDITVIRDTPSGDCDFVEFRLRGFEFMALSGGPLFKVNPSISFLVPCKTIEEVEDLWNKLLPGGSVLMPLDKYHYSERYGWLADKYGVSWQIIVMPEQEIRQQIVPTLMFVGELSGKAEEAMALYTSIFRDAKIDHIYRYGADAAPNKPEEVAHAAFTLERQAFAAMDSGHAHKFTFNEAVSLFVGCDSQEEIDHYWQLSAMPQSEQCGWIKDKYGVSWQISPNILGKMMKDSDPEKVKRVTEAFLQMKKIDIVELERVYEGK